MTATAQALAGASLLGIALATAAPAQETTGLGTIVLTFGATADQKGGADIDARDLDAVAPTRLSDLFGRESAVQVGGGAPASQRVHVHGFEESKLAVTVDGARQPANYWHHNGTSLIDPAFLKSVAVSPGVAGADDGFATGAGSLRYETVDAADLLAEGARFGGRISAMAGTNGLGRKGTLALYGMHGGFDWLAILSSHKGSAYRNGAGVVQRGTAPALTSGLLKLGHTAENGNRIEFSLERSRDAAMRLLRLNMDSVGGAFPENLNLMTRTTGVLRFSTEKPTATWDPVAELWFNSFDLKRPDNGYTRPSGAFNLASDSRGGKAQNTFTLGAGTLTVGADFMQHDVVLDRFAYPPLAAARLRESARQIGAFAQGEFDLGNGFGLDAGLRLDRQTFNAVDGQRFENSGLSGNLTLSYAISDALQIFASAGSSWMGLEQGEVALYHARDYTFDPAIRATRADAYKLGLAYSSGGWDAGLTLFDTTLRNPLAYDFATSRRVSGGDLRSRGFDLSLVRSWQSGRAGLKLSHADVTFNNQTVTPGATEAAPMGTTLTLFADHRIERWDLSLGASLEYAARLDDADLIAAGYLAQPSYGILDLYAEWTPQSVKGLSVRLGIDNLLDESYVARGTYPDFPVRGINAVESPGRTISLTATVKF
jgi:hemoglobin/transferrin/lactoferrin receptor protein